MKTFLKWLISCFFPSKAADKVETITWSEIDILDRANNLLIDVRNPTAYARGAIDGAVNIPAEQLLDNIDELPQDKRLVLYCVFGQNSYAKGVELSERGFDVANLEGGYVTYLYHKERQNEKSADLAV